MGAEIDVAADHLEQLVVEWGAEGAEDSEAKTLARALHDSVPVIAGAGLTSPIAYRWKTQFNENAKIPAFTHELPELCHNEVVGWQDAPSLGPLRRDLPRRQRHASAHQGAHRADARADRRAATGTYVVQSRGDTAVERVLSLVLLGDLVSLYVAVLRGIDPTPVDVLVTLKERLADGASTRRSGAPARSPRGARLPIPAGCTRLRPLLPLIGIGAVLLALGRPCRAATAAGLTSRRRPRRRHGTAASERSDLASLTTPAAGWR